MLVPPGTSLPVELEDDITILDFDPPSYSELRGIYANIIDGLRPEKRPQLDTEGMERILSAGIGLTHAEAETALSRAIVAHKPRLPNVTADDLANDIMKVKVESVKKTEILEVMPAVDMANVGGLENLKDWVAKRSRAYSDEARAFGIEPPKGIVLAGPPGTGKSLVAKAIAHTMGLPLLRFDVGRVFQSLVGQTEERVRATLKLVDGMAPCVLLYDEVDIEGKRYERFRHLIPLCSDPRPWS
jgi:SpoVK/Ycf46/Vps4 family AAA+-type ATPase